METNALIAKPNDQRTIQNPNADIEPVIAR
jgi:hypothetical protein